MVKQPVAEKRQRRERGSINPGDIIQGAFALADSVGIDNLSMPMLGKHLGVGVTSIYWYFRKKDDLLDAMTDRALSDYVAATPYIEGKDWRETLGNHARTMRKTFVDNPIQCDLILIRAALSPRAAKVGMLEMEKAISGLVEAGLRAEDAFDTYSAIALHVRGSVVLRRLAEKNEADEQRTGNRSLVIDPDVAPLLAQVTGVGHTFGVADENNFAFGLDCILDHVSRQLDGRPKATASTSKSRGKRAR